MFTGIPGSGSISKNLLTRFLILEGIEFRLDIRIIFIRAFEGIIKAHAFFHGIEALGQLINYLRLTMQIAKIRCQEARNYCKQDTENDRMFSIKSRLFRIGIYISHCLP